MDTSKITNTLIFKDGYYWLTLKCHASESESESTDIFKIVPDSWDINNGFEFPGDAYSYLNYLKSKTTEPEK